MRGNDTNFHFPTNPPNNDNSLALSKGKRSCRRQRTGGVQSVLATRYGNAASMDRMANSSDSITPWLFHVGNTLGNCYADRMKIFFKITTSKIIVAVAFIVVHVFGNLLYNRSLYAVDGKLFSNADMVTKILYLAPNIVVAPLGPLKKLFRNIERASPTPVTFVPYSIGYALYVYLISCLIVWIVQKLKNWRPGPL